MPSPYSGKSWKRPERVQGMSSRNPTTSAPMNNNPMGNQQTMTPQNAATMVPPVAPFAPTSPLPPASPAPQLPMVRPASPPANIPPSGVATGNIQPSNPGTSLETQTQPKPQRIRIPGSRGLPFAPSNPMLTVSPMPSRSMAQSDFGRALIDNTLNSAPQTGVLQPGARNPAMTADPFDGPNEFEASADPRSAGRTDWNSPATERQFAQTDQAMRGFEGMVERLIPGAQNIRNQQQSLAQNLNRPVERNRMIAAGGNPVINPDLLNPANPNGVVPNRMGGLSPRMNTSEAANVLRGQAPGTNTTMRPLNIPGTYMDQNGVQRRLYNPGGGYGANGQGIVPGSERLPNDPQAINAARGQAFQNGMSPDEFRVLSGGRALVPPQKLRPTPSVGDGLLTNNTDPNRQQAQPDRETARMTRMARQRGVRAADIPAWIDRRRAASQGFGMGGTPSADAMGAFAGGVSAITPGMAQQSVQQQQQQQKQQPSMWSSFFRPGIAFPDFRGAARSGARLSRLIN